MTPERLGACDAHVRGAMNPSGGEVFWNAWQILIVIALDYNTHLAPTERILADFLPGDTTGNVTIAGKGCVAVRHASVR